MAKRKGLSFELPQEILSELVQKECAYCSIPPSNFKRARKGKLHAGKIFKYNGLDRKDSSKGYTEDNVVTCCAKCNQIKTNILSFKEMIAVAKTLKKLK